MHGEHGTSLALSVRVGVGLGLGVGVGVNASGGDADTALGSSGESTSVHLLLTNLPRPPPSRSRHLFKYDLSNLYMEPQYQSKITALSWPQLPDANPLSCFYEKGELSRASPTCT